MNGNPVMNGNPNGGISKVIANSIIALALPLIKKYGASATTKAGNYLLKKIKKFRFFKKWAKNYKFQTNPKPLVVILKKTNAKTKKGKAVYKRVFAIDYAPMPKVARYIFTGNSYYKGIWHLIILLKNFLFVTKIKF